MFPLGDRITKNNSAVGIACVVRFSFSHFGCPRKSFCSLRSDFKSLRFSVGCFAAETVLAVSVDDSLIARGLCPSKVEFRSTAGRKSSASELSCNIDGTVGSIASDGRDGTIGSVTDAPKPREDEAEDVAIWDVTVEAASSSAN